MKVLTWVLALCLVLGIQCRPDTFQESLEEEEGRRPYSFKYTASRYHHGNPDREHEEVRGADGITRGVYRYIDPRQRVQEVSYTVDEGGFNVKNSAVPEKTKETNAVLTARTNHEQLFEKIREDHARIQAEQDAHVYAEENQEIYADVPFDYSVLPKHTSAVVARTALHQKLFEQTQAEHARIAEERGDDNEEEQQSVAVPFNYSALPRQTEAVLSRTAHHQTLFERIAAEHTRIGAERSQLQSNEEEHQQNYQQI